MLLIERNPVDAQTKRYLEQANDDLEDSTPWTNDDEDAPDEHFQRLRKRNNPPPPTDRRQQQKEWGRAIAKFHRQNKKR